MARNILTNGTFAGGTSGSLTGWTATNVSLYGGSSGQYDTGFSAKFDATTADAKLKQEFTTPGSTGSFFRARLTLRALNRDPALDVYLLVALGTMPSGANMSFGYKDITEKEVWHNLVSDMHLEGGREHSVEFKLFNSSYATDLVYVDDISLVALDPLANSAEDLALELMRRRNDFAGLLHARERYRQIVNQAIRQAPQRLWQPTINTTTLTVADTRRYALSLTGLTQPGQVRRIWMDDSDGNDQEIGRWQIENASGTLTLVLDEDPPEAGRTITIEYLAPYSTLDTLEFTDTTALDRDWLLARAMTVLLMEASPELEPLDRIHQMLTYWDSLRQSRERELLNQQPRPSVRFRSTRWGDYV